MTDQYQRIGKEVSRTCILLLAACVLVLTALKVEAKEVLLPDLGLTIVIPDSWKHEAKPLSGRVHLLLKPIRDEDPSTVIRCGVDRHDLPARFRKYSQDQLNALYAAKPLTADGFADRLSAASGFPVTVTAHGQAMLGAALAYWATTTSSKRLESTDAQYVSKTYVAQTPGFAWTIQCLSGSVIGPAQAQSTYKLSEQTFETFFSSIRFMEP